MHYNWEELNEDAYGTNFNPKTKEAKVPEVVKDKELNSNFSTNLKRILAGVGEYNKNRLLEAGTVSGSRAPAVSAGSSNTNTGANLSNAVANSIQARKQPSITYYDKLLGSFK